MLLRFREVVGVGRVAIADANTNLYRWTASSRRDVTATYEALAPWLGKVKRSQFEQALNVARAAACVEEGMLGNEGFAWAAGLFDGEGSVCLGRHGTHDGYFVIEADVTQSGFERPEVLLRFQESWAWGRWSVRIPRRLR